ncbi:MAG: MerR family transcriptional regulator [Bacteroidota bacterium]|nr:MerR family transcriptional regulator [Bacteroidota bacterium]
MEEEKKLYRIAQVTAATELPVSTIRHWTKEFPQVKPQKNAKGTIYYTHQDLQTIIQIKHLLKEQGLTIEGAKQHLKVLRKAPDQIDVIEKLKGVRRFLEELRDSC